jgi:hypothetical protein
MRKDHEITLVDNLTMTSGLLVAAMMVTPTNSWTPSISFNKLVSTPSWDDTPPSSESDREVPSASISSYGARINSHAAHRQKGTNKEYNGWRCCTSFPEYLTHCSLGFADVLAQELKQTLDVIREGRLTTCLGAFHSHKIDPALCCASTCKDCLTTSRWSVEEKALGWSYA